MRKIEELLRKINIPFKNLKHYEMALTHPSYNADVNTKHFDYERLAYMI